MSSSHKMPETYQAMLDFVLNWVHLVNTILETRPFVGPALADWEARCDKALAQVHDVIAELHAWYPDLAPPASRLVEDLRALGQMERLSHSLLVQSIVTAARRVFAYGEDVHDESRLHLGVPIEGKLTEHSMLSAVKRLMDHLRQEDTGFEHGFRWPECQKCSALLTGQAGDEWGPVQVFGHRTSKCTPELRTLSVDAFNAIVHAREDGDLDLSKTNGEHLRRLEDEEA